MPKTVYLVRFALSRGVEKISVEDSYNNDYISTNRYYGKDQFAYSWKEAKRLCEKKKMRKIKALKAWLSRLESLKFVEPK